MIDLLIISKTGYSNKAFRKANGYFAKFILR